jgi:hypothetical protein
VVLLSMQKAHHGNRPAQPRRSPPLERRPPGPARGPARDARRAAREHPLAAPAARPRRRPQELRVAWSHLWLERAVGRAPATRRDAAERILHGHLGAAWLGKNAARCEQSDERTCCAGGGAPAAVSRPARDAADPTPPRPAGRVAGRARTGARARANAAARAAALGARGGDLAGQAVLAATRRDAVAGTPERRSHEAPRLRALRAAARGAVSARG